MWSYHDPTQHNHSNNIIWYHIKLQNSFIIMKSRPLSIILCVLMHFKLNIFSLHQIISFICHLIQTKQTKNCNNIICLWMHVPKIRKVPKILLLFVFFLSLFWLFNFSFIQFCLLCLYIFLITITSTICDPKGLFQFQVSSFFFLSRIKTHTLIVIVCLWGVCTALKYQIKLHYISRHNKQI